MQVFIVKGYDLDFEWIDSIYLKRENAEKRAKELEKHLKLNNEPKETYMVITYSIADSEVLNETNN